MTSPGASPPSWDAGGGYEAVHTPGSSFGQGLDESKVRDLLRARPLNPFQDFLNNLVGGIANAIAGIFDPNGLFGGIGREMKVFRDGQQELNDRQDLLSPLLNYGTAFVSPNNRLHGTGFAAFTEQLGPMRGCEIITDGDQGGIRLGSEGLWDIRVQLSSDGIFKLLSDSAPFGFELRVYNPEDGSIYSKQEFYANHISTITGTIVSSVVVPGPNYRVRVVVTRMDSARGILAGPAWTRLTVQQITKDVEGLWNKGNEESDNPSTTDGRE